VLEGNLRSSKYEKADPRRVSWFSKATKRRGGGAAFALEPCREEVARRWWSHTCPQTLLLLPPLPSAVLAIVLGWNQVGMAFKCFQVDLGSSW
jgi:hypothetical protein